MLNFSDTFQVTGAKKLDKNEAGDREEKKKKKNEKYRFDSAAIVTDIQFK